MAALLGCTFGDLKQRDKERKSKRILNISIVSGAAFLLFGIFMANAYQKAEQARIEAVQSNANILMKTSKEFLKEGDYLKGVLVAKEAMGMISEDMKYYSSLISIWHQPHLTIAVLYMILRVEKRPQSLR